MNLVDSSGWLEYFAPVIENKEELLISSINIYEIYKKVLSERNEDAALLAVALMVQGKVIDVN